MLCVDLKPRALNVLMLRTQILLTLAGQDRTGRHVFNIHELAKLAFVTDNIPRLKATLQRMPWDGLLIRATKAAALRDPHRVGRSTHLIEYAS